MSRFCVRSGAETARNVDSFNFAIAFPVQEEGFLDGEEVVPLSDEAVLDDEVFLYNLAF
jgi:hypothetical protein